MYPINISFVIDSIQIPTAGTEKQLLLLLKSLDRSKYNSSLVCLFQSEWMREHFDICPVHEIGTKSPLSPCSWPKVFKLARHFTLNGIQIVHTFFRDASIAGIIAARIAHVPIVVSSRRNRGYWLNRFEIAVLRCLNRRVSAVIANSVDIKEFTHRVEGYPLEKINVIYNGIDTEFFKAASPESSRAAAERLGIPSGAPVAASIANLRPIKGIDVLIRALPTVTRIHPEFTLLIGGEGSEAGKLQNLVKELNLARNVRFLGSVKDVRSVLQLCDLGILSSHSESLSNSIVEYMAMGLPVVATDVGGTREMIKHGENGFLVPAGDSEALAQATLRVLRDRELMAKVGAENRKKAERMFGKERCIREHEELYVHLLHRKERCSADLVQNG